MLVERVETWVEHPIDRRPPRAIRPTATSGRRRRQGAAAHLAEAGGHGDLRRRHHPGRANPPTRRSSPSWCHRRPRQRRPPAPALPPAASERLADGVYRITGGYVSLAVEFKDHVVVLEGGQSEASGLAVIAETKRLFPTKRIKYVVNTHPHFDHARGLPPFIAEGVTVITDDNSKFFVEAAFSEPRTLVGDVLARSGKKPKVEGVIDTLVLKDDTRALELHHVDDLQHTDAMLIALLPQGAHPLHRGLQRAAARPAGQPVHRDARREPRSAEAGLRSPRDGARTGPGSPDDPGRPLRVGERGAVACARSWRWPTARGCAPARASLVRDPVPRAGHDRGGGRGRRVPVPESARVGARHRPRIRSGAERHYAAEWASRSSLEDDGIKKDTLREGDSVRIWASPNRNPNDDRIHLNRIERRRDRWQWGQQPAAAGGSVGPTYGAARPSARTTPVPLPRTSRPGAPLVARCPLMTSSSPVLKVSIEKPWRRSDGTAPGPK